MSAMPPTITTSSPGNTAQQNSANTSSTVQKYQYSFQQQSAKRNNPKLRFTLSVPNVQQTFLAHLDPNDVQYKQAKRLASLDVLTGVVLQDFGYKAPILEVKGTTGSAYYNEINTLNGIFQKQNIGTPAPVSITLEGYSYQAVWTDFSYGRSINQSAGNLVQYAMTFTVLQESSVQPQTGDTVAVGSSYVANTNNTNNGSTTSSASQQAITIPGTILQYVNSAAAANNIVNYKGQMIEYISDNWDTTQGPYPGLNSKLGSQTINVPLSWPAIITPSAST